MDDTERDVPDGWTVVGQGVATAAGDVRSPLQRGLEEAQAQIQAKPSIHDALTLASFLGGSGLGLRAGAGMLRTLGSTRMGAAAAAAAPELMMKLPWVGGAIRTGLRAYQATAPAAASEAQLAAQTARARVAARAAATGAPERLVVSPAEATWEEQLRAIRLRAAQDRGLTYAAGQRPGGE